MNQINDKPLDYGFGQDFNYAVWTPGTVIDMVSVAWNNDYRDIVAFPTRQALNDHINFLRPTGVRIEHMSYIKPNSPVRVDVPINRALRHNYLRASNPVQPIPGGDIQRDFYYFITDVRYIAPNTTELILQLDVWQTFKWDVTFGNGYVERGHIGVANEKNYDNFGREYLTVPEGLDLGSEYRTVAVRSRDYLGTDNSTANFELGKSVYDILVFSTVNLIAGKQDPGTVDDPKMQSATGSSVSDVPSGASAYVFSSASSFNQYMISMSAFPWITQGIIHISIIPRVQNYYTFPFTYAGDGQPTPLGGARFRPKLTNMFPDWRNQNGEISNTIPWRYRQLHKFFTYPYMYVEVTTWSGTPVTLKPESWWNPDAQVMERLTLAPPNQRLQFIPRQYNTSGQAPLNYRDINDNDLGSRAAGIYNKVRNTPGAPSPEELFGMSLDQYIAQYEDLGDDFGDYLDIMTQINQFPQGTVTNNGGIAYLAANSNAIDYQRESASWAQSRALTAAGTGYDQATKSLETANALNNIGINASMSQTGTANRANQASAATGAVAGLAGGVLGGALRGGAYGAAAGAVGAGIGAAAGMVQSGIQVQANNENLATGMLASTQGNNAAQSQGGYIRDTNKTLADWAARGDYANSIAGINAKVQDAAMIQPTVSGQYGGDAANHAHSTSELSIRWKMIDLAAIKRIGEYWLRYGYAVNAQVYDLPVSMMCMTKFTYWKLSETYLRSTAVPESFKQSIRGIFEKGVTVWRDPNDIGNIDHRDNEPLSGIRLL